jgi:hypothetical protein
MVWHVDAIKGRCDRPRRDERDCGKKRRHKRGRTGYKVSIWVSPPSTLCFGREHITFYYSSRRTIPRLDLDLDVDDGLDGSTLKADGVDGLEQRVGVRSLSGDEEVVDLLGGQGTLQQLSVEVVLGRLE